MRYDFVIFDSGTVYIYLADNETGICYTNDFTHAFFKKFQKMENGKINFHFKEAWTYASETVAYLNKYFLELDASEALSIFNRFRA